MLATEILENIKEDDVIIYDNRLLPTDPINYKISRVVSPRHNEHNCNSITQDILLVKGYCRVDYSKIIKVCEPNSNVYLLFSYLENLEFELKRAKELQNEYNNKLNVKISPRDDFNNKILNDALCDYITSHDNMITDIDCKIGRELTLLKKQ